MLVNIVKTTQDEGEVTVRQPNKTARERFEAAFPFLKGYNSSSVWHVVSAKGDYVGELNCSQSGFFREGWGEMRWANGTLYGPGNIFIYSQGDRYFGQWIRNKQEGMYLTLVELSSKKISKCINWMKTFFQRKVKLTRRR